MSYSVQVLSGTTFTRPYIDCVKDWCDFWRVSSSDEVKFTPTVLGVRSGFEPMKISELEFLDPQIVTLPKGEVSGSQLVRIVAAALSNSDYALLTDIDMIPLRPDYFHRLVTMASEQNYDFLIARDVLGEDQYPICYTLIRPRALLLEFEKLSLVRSDLTSMLWAVMCYMAEGDLQSTPDKGLENWYTDQRLLRQLIDSSEVRGSRVVRLQDKELGFKRLDRGFHSLRLSKLWAHLDKMAYFVDYHVHLDRDTRARLLQLLRANRGLD